MYLPIGNDMSVRTASVVGIFDMDNTTTSPRTRLFLEKAQKEGMVVSCDDLPKSYIVTVEYGMTRVYESTLSSYTLEKRLKCKKPRRNNPAGLCIFTEPGWGRCRPGRHTPGPAGTDPWDLAQRACSG